MDRIKFLGTAGARIVVRYQPGEHKIDHLNVEDVKKIIQGLRPRAALTPLWWRAFPKM
ncbi:hypothetical protein [Candidatus Hakubella thermalkaliphila]|uniref:hypothetical protein n=1 Tax=Candidatus Hakubella thermalkaliphila TaxID=2754717 RepID=UPI0015930B16|nr:hypothetical protein [Candidatus Hakubella thermalkaliphila]